MEKRIFPAIDVNKSRNAQGRTADRSPEELERIRLLFRVLNPLERRKPICSSAN